MIVTIFLIKSQQRRLNRIAKGYNHDRPDEALDLEAPESIHNFSARLFPEKTTNFDYDSGMRVLKVTEIGSMGWGTFNWVYLSASIQGKYVGTMEMEYGEHFM